MQVRLFYFLISTGMRFGEAAALTWNDIDLTTGEIRINKTAVAIHGSTTIQDRTKTTAGTRTIFVGQNITDKKAVHLLELLELHKKEIILSTRGFYLICYNFICFST